MAQTVEAIYEDGILRPTQPLEGVAEHSKVRVTVEVEEQATHPLADCVGILPNADADEMRRIIEQEFERVNPVDRGAVYRARLAPGDLGRAFHGGR